MIFEGLHYDFSQYTVEESIHQLVAYAIQASFTITKVKISPEGYMCLCRSLGTLGQGDIVVKIKVCINRRVRQVSITPDDALASGRFKAYQDIVLVAEGKLSA